MKIDLSKDHLEMLLELFNDLEESLTPREVDLYEILLDAYESYSYGLEDCGFED